MSSLLEESFPAAEQPSAAASSPIKSYQYAKVLNGLPTELLVQTFDDRILIILTQLGKIGSLTQASLPANTPLQPAMKPFEPPTDTSAIANLRYLPPPSQATQLTPLLGVSTPLYNIYISQIATIAWWTLQATGGARRPIVVGLALKRLSTADDDDDMGDDERERFAEVMDLVGRWPGMMDE